MKRVLAATLFVALGARSSAAPLKDEPATIARSPELSLSDGKLAYQRGDYPLAVRTLTPLLYPSIALTSEDAVVEAHRILALSYLLQKQEPEAEEEATSILALRPSYQLDPIVDPPMAVAFFDGVRKKQESRLRELRERELKETEARAKEDEIRRRANAERVYIERSVQKHSRLLATIPFGVGQWQNGQTTKAALFGAGELLFGALSLSAYIAIDERFSSYDPTTHTRTFPVSQHGTAVGLTGLQLAAGAAFWATLLAGIIDAHVYYKPEVVKTREILKPHVTVTPIVGPGTAGLGVGGKF